MRGHVAVAADAGFRLTAERTQGLTEIATAFFPRKVPGIQAAFRLSDPAWQATLRVERLPQTVQADAFHLFSIGEGIAYGSSVMNYLVSGAPVSAFKVELSDEYFNVEFTGKDIRNWQKTAGGYLVQLHTPVSGAYTLLATYERPFKAQGETLTFTGARPLDAQSEQGYTIIISAYQFQVKPDAVSPGLLPLEPGEVPPEYRLFFDAPILAAYRYTSRPFDLKLALSPLAQGDSLSQVVDRASITTRISKEGQALTDVRYFVKNRGNPNFRLTLPPGTQLWSAAVNGAPVVPVTDAQANLIPLPQHADPNAVLTLDLKLAGTNDPKLLTVAAPIVNAPVMLAEWKLEPDTGQRLVYRRGSLTPAGGIPDISGFAALARMFTGDESSRALDLAFRRAVVDGAGGGGLALGGAGRSLSVQCASPRRRAARPHSLRAGDCGVCQSGRPGAKRKRQRAARRDVAGAGAASRQRPDRRGCQPRGQAVRARLRPSRLARSARAGGVGVWLDNRPPGVKDRGLGSRLDAARLGGPAVSERRATLPRCPCGLPAAASRDPRAAQALAVAAPTAARPAAGDPERRRARGHRLARGRLVVAWLVQPGQRGGTCGRFQINAACQGRPAGRVGDPGHPH